MTEKELIDLIDNILSFKCESTNIELKTAKNGCPESLYDTLSSFSNTEGGIIIFGVDERNGFKITGIDDAQILQKKITEQSLLMEPVVRPLYTVAKYEGKIVCSVEIPEIDEFLKPCYYKGKGRNKGSYTRVGEADLPMTEYELHCFDAFKYKIEDELRTKERIDISFLNDNLINSYISKLIDKKPNLMNFEKNKILLLEGIVDKNGLPTLCGIMNFGSTPQIYSPNLDIIAVRCATNMYAEENSDGIRFIDNKRIDGTISSMLQQAISFIQNNTRNSTFINPLTGNREDKSEYPIKALREIILNALIHRDYSIYSENDPIRIEIYDDRVEISNPGGLYGKLSINELGKTRSDIRNPYIASILETLEITENRYSGIPIIYNEMKRNELLPPKFEDYRGRFKVTLFNAKNTNKINDDLNNKIVEICSKPRTKEFLAKEFGFDEKRPSYFITTYVEPLIKCGVLKYTIPNKPKSKNQKIVAINKGI